MRCPHCGASITPHIKFCGSCGQAVNILAKSNKSSKGNKFLKFALVLVGIIGIAIFTLWFLKLGPFYPQIRLTALSIPELEGDAVILPPTNQEMHDFSNYLSLLEDRSYQRMNSQEKALAADLQQLSHLLVTNNYSIDDITSALKGWHVDYIKPDFQLTQLELTASSDKLTNFFSPIDNKQLNYYSANASSFNMEGIAGGLSQLSQFLSSLNEGEEGEENTGLTQEEILAGLNEIVGAIQNGASSEAGANDNPLVSGALSFLNEILTEAENEGLTEPTIPAHGNWPRIAMATTETELLCHACGAKNETGATNCYNCHALLTQPVFMVGLDIEPPPIIPPPDEFKPSYNAVTLNNIANEMMLQGYADLPYFLACMAAIDDPLNTDVICTIANLLKTSEDYENALACAEYALRLAPNEEDLLYTAGMISLKLDEVDKAAAFFNRALRVSGGGGPGNQGMMMVSLARQDFPSAYLYMLEGGRDAFTTSIWDVYQKMKFRPDYYTLSGSIFDQYTLLELMNFKRNRTAFDPTLDTVGQQISIGKMSIPMTANDWAASCGYIFEDSLKHLKGYGKLLAEDINQLKEIVGIFSTPDLKEITTRFQSSSFAQKPQNEAEQMVSYEQEIFWLNILNDYLNWELKKIENDRKATLNEMDDGIDINEIIEKMYIENFGDPDSNSLAATVASMILMANNIETNNSLMFTVEQGNTIMNIINNYAGIYGESFNTAYEKTRILCEEYWLYSNAILGLIADDNIYNEYRTTQRHNVMTSLAPYAIETTFFSITIYQTYGIAFMFGNASAVGMQSGYIPDAPTLKITGKGATPYALMYGDVYIPNLTEAVHDIIGLSQEEIAENIRMQMEREQQDEYQKWWNSLTPQERVMHSAVKADPSVLTRQLILQPYGGSGLGVIGFYEESADHKLAAAYTASNGVAKLKVDTNGNVNLSVKDMVGISANPKDVTIYAGASKGTPDLSVGNASISSDSGASADAKIYATYNYGKRQFTSGGVKAGVSARLGSAVGIEAKTGHNVVTGLTSGDIGVIWGGKKFGIRGIQSWNLW